MERANAWDTRCGQLSRLRLCPRKAHKAIAASLGEALPPMLSVLESALQNNPSGAGLLAVENLAEVAEAQPRLFKPVLAQVVEGMSALALKVEESSSRAPTLT